jgi:tetratricopeptide (TPR) repeat protein
MLTGKKPFKGDFDEVMFYAVLHTNPESVSNLNPEISPGLEKIIQKAMAKNPKDRYQSVGDMIDDLFDEKGNSDRTIIGLAKILGRVKIFSTSKLGIISLISTVIVIILFYILPISVKESPSISRELRSLVIMNFKNNTGDEDLDYLGRNISDLMIADLNQSPFMDLLNENKLYEILSELDQVNVETYTSQTLKEIADRGQSDHIITGKYTRVGNIYRISVTFQNIFTEIHESKIVEGTHEQLFEMVDILTAWIRTRFNFSDKELAEDIDEPITKIMTTSPKALKYYSLSKKHKAKGEYDISVRHLNTAIFLDPTFAMAHIELAEHYTNRNLFYLVNRHLQKAMDLRERLPKREQLIIEGRFYTHNYLGKALETYRELVELYPNDVTGYLGLKDIYLKLDEYDKAIEYQDQVIRMVPDNLYLGFLDPYLSVGNYKRAVEILAWYGENYPLNRFIYHGLYSDIYSYHKQYELALLEIDKADSLSPTGYAPVWRRGRVFLFMKNFAVAEEMFNRLLEMPDESARSNGITCLFGTLLTQGKIKQARTVVEQGIEWAKNVDEGVWENWYEQCLAKTHFVKGEYHKSLELSQDDYFRVLSYLKLGLADSAQSVVENCKLRVEKYLNKKLIREYYHLKGIVELEKGNFSEAITLIKKGIELLLPNPEASALPVHHAIMYNSLAMAYKRSGDLDKAQAEYTRILDLVFLKVYYGYIISKSNYELAKIFEQKGKTEKAKEYYKEFLDIWKEADEDLPELSDAKKRLANLR